MNETLRVRGIERESHLGQDPHRPGRIQRAVTEDQLAKILAVHVVHGEEQEPVLFARIVDPHHIRVIDRRGYLHLPLEALAELRVLGQLGSQHLERVHTAQRDVRHAVHDPHPALPDLLLDAIPAELRASLEATAP